MKHQAPSLEVALELAVVGGWMLLVAVAALAAWAVRR